jgi:hypothetical protein
MLAVLSGTDGGHELRQELAWVVPPGWVLVEPPVGDIAAHDPQDPMAVVVVLHNSTGRPMEADFLRKALERFPAPRAPLVAAMLGTCSDGQRRFACEELQIRPGERLDVAYAWVDERRGWGFEARYTVPLSKKEQMLPLVRRLVGWQGTKVIRE